MTSQGAQLAWTFGVHLKPTFAPVLASPQQAQTGHQQTPLAGAAQPVVKVRLGLQVLNPCIPAPLPVPW